MKYALIAWVLVFHGCVQGCVFESGQADGAATMKPDIVLGVVQIDTRTVRFYIHLGEDSAILGFSVENDSGQPLYFPVYGSTYRGLPSVTLDVFLSESKEELWVRSSWIGYEILAYHRIGTDRCITKYGEITASYKPTPDDIIGETSSFPEMDVKIFSNIATLTYDKESQTR